MVVVFVLVTISLLLSSGSYSEGIMLIKCTLNHDLNVDTQQGRLSVTSETCKGKCEADSTAATGGSLHFDLTLHHAGVAWHAVIPRQAKQAWP